VSGVVLRRDTGSDSGRDTGAVGVRVSRATLTRFAVTAGLFVLLGLGAVYARQWWETGRFVQSTDDAYVGGNVTPIAPHVAGFVASVAVTDNQFVRAGDVLVRLDDRDYQAALAGAEASVAQHRAMLADLEAQVGVQQQTIAQAEANLRAADAKASFASADARRYGALALTAAGSVQQAQRSGAADTEAASAAAQARASLAAAVGQLKVLSAQIEAARAAVGAAEAARRSAELNLGYTVIRSPIDGYVGNRAAQLGGYVSVGSALLSIVPAHGLWVDANFKEDQLARMRAGETARVRIDVLPGLVFEGRVASLSPATGAVFSVIPAENATGNFTKIVQRVPVRILLDDAALTPWLLRPGLSALVAVDTRSADR
jgi:membrane fusion protein (multidrug efflux system)